MIKAKCDNCNEEFFILNNVTLPIKNDIEFIGFNCPECGKKYGHYVNNKIKKLQEQQQKLLKSGKHAKGVVLKNILAKIEAKKKEIADEMNVLRAEIEGDADG